MAMLPRLTIDNLSYKYKMKFISKPPTQEQIINYTYKVALERIASIPYSYVMDLYRWLILNGTISPEEYNSQYWKIR